MVDLASLIESVNFISSFVSLLERSVNALVQSGDERGSRLP